MVVVVILKHARDCVYTFSIFKLPTLLKMAEQQQQHGDITIVNLKPGQTEDKGLDFCLRETSLRDQAKQAHELFNTIQDELDHREEDLKDGLSFLDMKNDTLLSYMIDVCNIVLRKVRGESIEDHGSVKRCIEYRVILEKIKAIDQKLAYQLNKLITLPDDAEVEDQRIDVRNLNINLDINSDDNDEKPTASGTDDSQDDSTSDDDEPDSEENEDDEDEDEQQGVEEGEDDSGGKRTSVREPKSSGGVYKPPKLRSVAYTEEGEFNRGNKGRRRNYDEFYKDDTGEVIDEYQRDDDPERIRFEEDNYTRLPDENPKKAKRKLRTKEYRRKGKKKFKGKR